ncbi:MAG TPA: adenosylmethionine decarboxylase [Magnetospirillaceae bacterium]|nr:adenosylmethionine decarboxylase [Magnetospirillaceae bacterium]
MGSPCSFTLWGVGLLKAPGALGTHIIVELSDCNPKILADVDKVANILVAAAKEANAEVLQTAFHRFTPQGVSGVVVIAESHLSIHTWPEYGYAAMDIYTCGDKTDPWKACRYAAAEFQAKQMLTTEVRRGMTNEDGVYSHSVGHKTTGVEPVAKNRKLSVVR